MRIETTSKKMSETMTAIMYDMMFVMRSAEIPERMFATTPEKKSKKMPTGIFKTKFKMKFKMMVEKTSKMRSERKIEMMEIIRQIQPLPPSPEYFDRTKTVEAT